MIQANELRIGNYVEPAEPEYKGQYFKVQSGDIKHIQDGSKLYKYKSIPLTPEILEKAGFNDAGESAGSIWYYRLINIPSNYMNPTYELNLFTTDEQNKYGINLEEQYFGYCKSLHQLQNLYFALTGEELPIEL